MSYQNINTIEQTCVTYYKMLHQQQRCELDQNVYLMGDNFIMYDNLQQAINHKRFSSIPRHYPHLKFYDMSSVQPWEKNTLEFLLEDQPPRQAKTFYQLSKKNQHSKCHTMMRGFSFRTERSAQPIKKVKSVAATSQKSSISHYNINGNILGQLTHSPKSLHFQLPLKNLKMMRHREKLITMRPADFSESKLKVVQTLTEMKRKLKLQKQKSDEGFVYFNRETDQERFRVGNVHRKSKVIALGFKKLSMIKKNRQKSNRSKLSNQNI